MYVDYMITKFRVREDHVANLQKLFDRFCKYRLYLNLTKYTFRVISRKLLGSSISKKGIEVVPNKVRAIQEMPAPQTEKQI